MASRKTYRSSDNKPASSTSLQGGVDSRPAKADSSSGVAGPSTAISGAKDSRPLASIREKPVVDAVTGSLSLKIPIDTSPGRNGFEPSLSLSYDSGVQNGHFGIGWGLNIESISRKTSKKIPTYRDLERSDAFLLGSDELVGTLDDQALTIDGFHVTHYRSRIETTVRLIQRWSKASDPDDEHWRVITGDNLTTVYGRTDESRVFQQSDTGPKHVFEWLISEQYDGLGNNMAFSYKAEDSSGVDLQTMPYERNRDWRAGRYLKLVRYGNRKPNRDLKTWGVIELDKDDWLFEVVLDYGEHSGSIPGRAEAQDWALRNDPFSTYTSGFEVRTYRLCQRILVFHRMPEKLAEAANTLVSSTAFSYNNDPASAGGALMISCTRWGYSGGKSQSLPPMDFEYSTPPNLSDLSCVTADTKSVFRLPTELQPNKSQWVDLACEGTPGVVTQLERSWWYQRNESALTGTCQFSPAQELKKLPNMSAEGSYFQHLNADGQLEFVGVDSVGNIRGYSSRKEEGDWTNIVPFSSVPVVEPGDDRVVMVDLTGNGAPDILRITNDGPRSCWYPALGTIGFGPSSNLERTDDMPTISPSNEQAKLYAADMSGDGLADLVTVSYGEVYYWPNMGHGRFGKRVFMGNAPRPSQASQFTHARVRLVDVNGTGTTDIIYLLPGGGAEVYFNCSGNRLSDAHHLPQFPEVTHLTAVEAIDLLGQGTACLCWTSTRSPGQSTETTFRYIDLMNGSKPWLLTKYINNNGASTAFTYKPSTRYYLEDEREGKPWHTKLPFPVYCMDRMVTSDAILQKSVTTRFSYHDAYFDFTEREFRGFGIVDQWDAEEFSSSSAAQLQLPPNHTRTWFHTGTLDVENTLTEGQLQKSMIPASRTRVELADAYRALKGLVLRQHIYSDDSSSLAELPYTISESRYEVTVLQEADENGHRVFRTISREAISVNTERTNDQDPRVGHEFVLETNAYGQTTKSLSVSYGRAQSPLTDPRDKAQQEKHLLTYSEQDYTNAIDVEEGFKVPLPSENRVYHILGASISGQITFEELVKDDFAFFKDAKEIPVDQVKEPQTDRQKVLISRSRDYYLSSSLEERLDYGQLELYSIADQSYDLALTSGLISNSLPDDKDVTGMMLEPGRYADIDGNGNFWVPSERTSFVQLPEQKELEEARKRFYIPYSTIDPFDAKTDYIYDSYLLLMVKTVDPVGNTTAFVNDYVTLQPTTTIDQNGNRKMMAYDIFGQAVGVAVMGKEGETVGDTLDGFEPNLSIEELDTFIADPSGTVAKTLLKSAGKRTISDPGRYHRSASSGQLLPTYEADLARDIHGSQDAQISIVVRYFDGAGNLTQVATLVGDSKWRFSGWVVNDNKGQPVRQYNPFFHSSPEFRFLGQEGSNLPSTTTLRDAVNRVVGTLNPDHTWSKVRYLPWSSETFDTGDTVLVENPAADQDVGMCFKNLDTESYLPTWHQKKTASEDKWDKDSAEKSAKYANTSQLAHLDALGRPIAVIADNGSTGKSTFRYSYDVMGNEAGVWDALDRRVAERTFDMAAHCLHNTNMDSGERWAVADCSGAVLLEWNSRGTRMRASYDNLGRITEQSLLEKDAPKEKSVVKFLYGEGQDHDIENNLRGQTFQTLDQAGVHTNAAFDFKGNCVLFKSQLASEYKSTLDWSSSTLPSLESDVWEREGQFDALNREWTTTAPDGTLTKRTYGISGDLQAVYSLKPTSDSEWDTYISNIDYAEDGQRVQIDYGNGSTTKNTYSVDTRVITNTETIRATDKKSLSNLTFHYDCLGRLTHRVDASQQDIYFRNNKITPDLDFQYDPIGRLVEARGREQVDVSNGGGRGLKPYTSTFTTGSSPGDGAGICAYTETYNYDLAGNLLKLIHAASDDASLGGWTRTYFYEETGSSDATDVVNNRLSRTVVGSTTEQYEYAGDAGKHGCMTKMPGYSLLSWDFNDRLKASAKQVVNKGTPETTWYVYDAAGARLRKVTESAATNGENPKKSKETLYLASYEVSYTYSGDGSVKETTKTAQILDSPGSQSIALLESNANNSGLVRYQLSENIEIDDQAQVISYTEYSPFGAVTYSAKRSETEAPRKYLFARYGRDDETGLYHCGERYYAAWIGRWTSADPIGIGDGLNPYTYVSNDPVNFDDGSGMMKDRTTPTPAVSSSTGTPATSGGGDGLTPSTGGSSHAAPVTAPRSWSSIVSSSNGMSAKTGAGAPASSLSSTTTGSPGPSTSTAAGPSGTGKARVTASASSKAAPSTSKSSSSGAPSSSGEVIRLYRSTDAGRGYRFLNRNDVSAVKTMVSGDFNHLRDTAAYFTDDPRSALERAQGSRIVIEMDVPIADLQSNVINYGPVPTKAWQKRVNYDRLETPFEAGDSQQAEQFKEISIGPESNVATGVYEELGDNELLSISRMNPLYRVRPGEKGHHVQQYVFKGSALDRLASYQKRKYSPPSGVQKYAGGQVQRSPMYGKKKYM